MCHIRRLVCHCCALAALSTQAALVTAAGGVITFSGAVTEPVCNVQQQTINLDTLSKSGADQPIPLRVYCNGNQSVRISILDLDGIANASTFSGGISGVEIAIRQDARLIVPGHELAWSFTGKTDSVVPLSALWRHAADALGPQHGTLLVTFDYR